MRCAPALTASPRVSAHASAGGHYMFGNVTKKLRLVKDATTEYMKEVRRCSLSPSSPRDRHQPYSEASPPPLPASFRLIRSRLTLRTPRAASTLTTWAPGPRWNRQR